MKIKKILTAGVIASSFALLASCGGSGESSSKASSAPSNSSTPSESSASGSSSASSSVLTDYYKVQVVYEDGTPARDIIVQWCNVSGDCYAKMETTDSSGYVTTTDKQITSYDNDLTVHLFKASLPECYSFDPNELVQNKNNREGVIHLVKLNSNSELKATDTEGKDASSAIEVSVGAYNINAGKNSSTNLWLKMNITEAGTYVFESHAESSLDPLLQLRKNVDALITNNINTDNGGKEKNFKYELVVSEEVASKNLTFNFVVQQKTNLEEAFLLTITKK